MANPPKSSLVERLVQNRMRAGELEPSAAHLLQLGEGLPGDATRLTPPDAASAETPGDADVNQPVRPPPITAIPGAPAPAAPTGSGLPFSSAAAAGVAAVGPAALPPIPLNPITLGASLDG